ncbi:MAG: PIN domain-containing protein [Victivallaceae bacterium]|nr:PIN domain-containing protein [Victivallaceae bacterium]
MQKLVKYKSQYNLCLYDETSEEFLNTVSLANTYFNRAYPPRKKKDTSCGDRINWEWCLHCVKNIDDDSQTHDLVIVSRDSDYGITYNGQSYINDWLRKEFAEKISRKRKIILTNSLVEGLKHIDVTVSRQTELAEKREIIRLARLEAQKELWEQEEGICFCGSNVLFDAQCSKCWEYVLGDADGEAYRIENNRIYAYDQFGEERLLKCDKCGCDKMHIEYGQRCSWCEHRASKDD